MSSLVFVNGLFYTSDINNPTASAVAISDGKFIYVGSNDGVKSFIDKDTEIIDLKGSFVMAGITDGHCHPFAKGLGSIKSLSLCECESANEYIEKIRQYIKDNPDKKEIRGRGWVNSCFENMCPTKDLLDELANDKPICMRSTDAHSVWVNSYLLKKAGIDENTKDIPGGKIEKDEFGKPNGCIRDAAMRLIQDALDDFTVEQYKEVILLAQKHYASLGYTGYLEALINENYRRNLHTAYKELEKEGKLLLNSYANYVIFPSEDCLERVEEARSWMDETANHKYSITSIKMFVDGVVEGGTALLKKPYETNSEYYGADRWPDNKLFEAVIEKANSLEIPVHIHSIGDGATGKIIDTIENVQSKTNKKDLRNIIAHLQVVDYDDLDRMAKQNTMALLNPWCSKEKGFFEEAEVYYLGKERAQKEYLVKSFFDKGVRCSFGTDYPLDPLCNPFVAMQVFVQRMNNNDPETLLNPEERITIQQAIEMFTMGPVYQVSREFTKGSISVGKDADLVVLNQNLLEITNEKIGNTKPLMTVVNGKIVYKV